MAVLSSNEKDVELIDSFNSERAIFHSGLAASVDGSTGTRHSCGRTLFNPFSYAVDSDGKGRCIIELRPLGPICPVVKDRPFKFKFQLIL
ncbi:hypothetical protein Ciccas_014145 [Cichlidogyrus casuarinus]|uniref:Uncharacterized protein n=1 Tax=Cichlidogyrus casuarinus TaxID=1844966 RepID=A0ABD2PJK6_9PLAT